MTQASHQLLAARWQDQEAAHALPMLASAVAARPCRPCLREAREGEYKELDGVRVKVWKEQTRKEVEE